MVLIKYNYDAVVSIPLRVSGSSATRLARLSDSGGFNLRTREAAKLLSWDCLEAKICNLHIVLRIYFLVVLYGLYLIQVENRS
jgi:hypothetical protein